MVDPNKPIIDTRSTILGGRAVVAPTTPTNDGNSTATDRGNGDAQGKRATVPAPAVNPGPQPTPTSVSTTIPPEYKASSYAELIPQLEKRVAEYKPLTEEQLEKLRRKQKAEGIISGISEAVRSVANLIATHNYAPNMYNATDGMSARTKARFEKEKADREAADDRWFNYAMTLGRLKDADKEKGFRAWQAERSFNLKQQAEDRAQAKAERDALVSDLKAQLLLGKIDEQEYATKIKEADANYRDRYWNYKLDKPYYNPHAGARSGGGKKPYAVWNGVVYDTKADYERAVEDQGQKAGVTNTEVRTTTNGLNTTERQVKKPTAQKAAEIDAVNAKKNQQPQSESRTKWSATSKIKW